MFKVLISLATEAKGTEHSKAEESSSSQTWRRRRHSSKVNLLEQPAQASKPSSLFLSVEGEGLEVFFELLLFFKAEFFVKEGHFFVVVEGNAFLLFSGFDSLTVVCFDFQA